MLTAIGGIKGADGGCGQPADLGVAGDGGIYVGVNQRINRLIGWFTDLAIGRLMDWFVGWNKPIDRLIDFVVAETGGFKLTGFVLALPEVAEFDWPVLGSWLAVLVLVFAVAVWRRWFLMLAVVGAVCLSAVFLLGGYGFDWWRF